MSKATKATLGLMAITLFSKIIGFIREAVLVTTYGTSIVSDAYITAVNIPWILFGIIGTALGTAFIPVFFEVEKEEGKDNAIHFVNNVINIVIIFSCALAIIAVIFSEQLIHIMAMSFEGEKLVLATNFSRIMAFGVIFISLNSIMASWLQIKNQFTISGMSIFPYNILLILAIIISSYGNVYIMAIGTLIAWMIQFLFQYFFATRNGFRYKFEVNIKDKYIKKMIILILPMLIGVGVSQINLVVDRTLASSLGDGVITILNGADMLNSSIQGLFISSIIVVVYPMLSRISIYNDDKKISSVIAKSVNIIILIIIPISMYIIVLAQPIVRVVFQRGQFNSNDTINMASALSAYAIGLVGVSLREIFNRIFYSFKDTKTPMINGVLSMILNIIFNLCVMRKFGFVGLALSTSVSSIVCTVLLCKSLKKNIKYFGQDKILKTLIKCLFVSIITSVATKYVYDMFIGFLGNGILQDIVAMILGVSIGGAIYIILGMLLNIEEIHILLIMIKKKLKFIN